MSPKRKQRTKHSNKPVAHVTETNPTNSHQDALRIIGPKDPTPRRKIKTKPSVFDGMEKYQNIKNQIMNGTMNESEYVELIVDPAKATEEWKISDPGRTIANRYRKLVKDLGESSSYRISHFENNDGTESIRVVYEPPKVKSRASKKEA